MRHELMLKDRDNLHREGLHFVEHKFSMRTAILNLPFIFLHIFLSRCSSNPFAHSVHVPFVHVLHFFPQLPEKIKK